MLPGMKVYHHRTIAVYNAPLKILPGLYIENRLAAAGTRRGQSTVGLHQAQQAVTISRHNFIHSGKCNLEYPIK